MILALIFFLYSYIIFFFLFFLHQIHKILKINIFFKISLEFIILDKS